MRWADIIKMAWHNLRQRKLRTCLNLVGIVLGCIIVLLTAAGANGVQTAFQILFDSSEFAREMHVSPGYGGNEEPPESECLVVGEMSDKRRKRIREALVSAWQNDHRSQSDYEISLEQIDKLRTLPGIQRVVVDTYESCQLDHDADWASAGNHQPDPILRSRPVSLSGIDVLAPKFESKLLAGEMIKSPEMDILVSEFLAYRMGFRDDDELENLVGQQLTVSYQVNKRIGYLQRIISFPTGNVNPDFGEQTVLAAAIKKLINSMDQTDLSMAEQLQIKMMAQALLPAAKEAPVTKHRTFRVCGVLGDEDDDTLDIGKMFKQWFSNSTEDLMLHSDTAFEIQQQQPEPESFHSVKLIADSTSMLRDIDGQVEDMGLSSHSALMVWDNMQYQINATTWVIYLVALTILLTSAIGISNTLIISVMQRTTEFGILKSIGMRDRDLLSLMLCEGALLGAIGATVATIFATVLGVCGRTILSAYVSHRVGEQIDGNLFEFSFLPIVAMFVVSILICVVASLVPAWRAARLDPVVAMRRM